MPPLLALCLHLSPSRPAQMLTVNLVPFIPESFWEGSSILLVKGRMLVKPISKTTPVSCPIWMASALCAALRFHANMD